MSEISCTFVLEKAAAWSDDQLSDAEVEVLSAHLERCKKCSEAYRELDRLKIQPPRLKKRSLTMVHNDQFWAKMDEEIDAVFEEEQRTSGSSLDWKHGVLAALVLLAAGWGLYSHHRFSNLEVVVETQQREIDRFQRIYAKPSVENVQPYVLPTSHIPKRVDL